MIKRLSMISALTFVAASFSAPVSADTPSRFYGSHNGSDDSHEASDAASNAWRSNASCASGAAMDRHHKRGRPLQVVGMTGDNRLICFNEHAPQAARSIDLRVQSGLLYGVGNAGGVYVLDTSNAVAMLVNRLTVPLDGSASYEVDFNPTADRLRIASNKGQNLRHNVNADGVTLADAPLNYTPGTVALGIVGSACTNNDLSDTTATTLYALDSTLDQIAVQSPPNNGSLAATGKLTVNATEVVGLDNYSTIRNGVTVDVQALASIKATDGSMGMYSVKLPTGKATLRGNFGGQTVVTDIAIPLNQV